MSQIASPLSQICADITTTMVPLFEKSIFSLKEIFYSTLKKISVVALEENKETNQLTSAMDIIAALTKTEAQNQASAQVQQEKLKLNAIIEGIRKVLIQESNLVPLNKDKTINSTIKCAKNIKYCLQTKLDEITIKQIPKISYSPPNQFTSKQIDVATNLQLNSNATKFNSIIHYIKGDRLTIFDTVNKDKKILILNKQHLHIDSISVNNKIYIMGGGNTTEMFEIDAETNGIALKDNMLTAKFGHSLCYSAQIYSIGGYNSTALTDCQKYNLQKDKWVQLPNLHTERYYCASFIFEFSQIYVLGGYKTMLKESSVSQIEKLNIFSPTYWEILKLNCPFSLGSIHALQINSSQALIFGGDQVETYVMSLVGSMDFKKGPDMRVKAEFNESSAPIQRDDSIYGVDQLRNIHVYKISEAKWEIIKF